MNAASPLRFGAAAGGLLLGATLLVAKAPLEFALASVFLFAGPHNWMEFRYAVARLPSRLAVFRRFFSVALGGIVLLTVGSWAIPGAARFGGSARSAAMWALLWNLSLVGWIAGLAYLRSRERPVRDWPWLLPLALAIGALVCVAPTAWSLALVYAHPVVSFVVLDRELRRHHRQWRQVYHVALAAVPLAIVLLCWTLRDAPPLAGEGTDALTMRLVAHAGAREIPILSTRALVAALALLELLHYAVWIVALPVVTGQGAPWRAVRAAITRGWVTRQRAFRLALGLGAAAVLTLWIAFTADYARARDLYFTLAIAHVLAEVPVVLRLV